MVTTVPLRSRQGETDFRPLLSVAEAAKKLNIGRTLLYDLMGGGEMPFVRVGRTRRILRSHVEAFMKRNLIGGGSRES